MAASFSLGLFSGWENFFEDLLFSPKPVDSEIVILAIDSESINRLGQWPWSREIFAKGFLKLNEARPKAIGFDVMLSESSRSGEKDDLILNSALQDVSYPVVFPVEAIPLFLTQPQPQAPNLLKPLSIFTANQNIHLGHVNLILDKDGVARRFPLRIETQGEVVQEFRAFAYEVLKQSRRNIPAEVDLETVPRIVFASPAGSLKRIPFWRLLEEDLREQFKDKIVFVGATAPDLHDEQLKPLEKGMAIPGVEIQANIANMLVFGYRLVPLSRPLSLLWIFLAAILPALVFVIFSRSLKPIFVNIVVGVLYLILIIVLFEKGMAVNILHVNFSWFLSTSSLFGYRYFAGEKERREMKDLFSKYVSKDVLEEILKDPSRVALGGEEKEITVFFSDIRGFTTLSEKTTPKELVHILNRYFTLMSQEILENGGVLDKYIGDAIMAFWGAPVRAPNQADNALRASLGMLKKLKEFNKELREAGEPEINIGIGLHTGPAVVGNIGSEQRFDYTIIGDTVNVASRLEGLNKQYGTNIIIGESTKNKIKGAHKFKFLGQVTVKGRVEPLNVYTLEMDS
ncbi:MAG: adenylate/guanylate cyclase domain-containing protein [Candidatus Magasanikbacteria bacterium]|nr:adenylate/guanylate cyclase domain-containing protein [Candidatus Magasanikbacteria bacterium]